MSCCANKISSCIPISATHGNTLKSPEDKTRIRKGERLSSAAAKEQENAPGERDRTGYQLVPQGEHKPVLKGHDPELLDRARMQWQFGDWESLVDLDEKSLDQHPHRAKLALLAASARHQLDDHAGSRHLIRLAANWGCDRKLIARILIAGVHNTLARAAALAHDEARALEHFGFAVEGVSGDARLACQARSVREVARLELFHHASAWAEQRLSQPSVPVGSMHNATRGVIGQETQRRMKQLAEECTIAGDIHAAVDSVLGSPGLDRDDAFWFCISLSDEFKNRKDNMTAVHYLNVAYERFDEVGPEAVALLSGRLLALGRREEALDLLIARTVSDSGLAASEQSALNDFYAKVRAMSKEKADHGHALMLAYLRKHIDEIRLEARGRKLVFIEIGSTRENVAGQGSTRIIAEFCSSERLGFITVDMDPHNSDSAASMFRDFGVDFSAVNQKGEDFLREYSGEIDLIFLDAYDFDHGRHSALRQSRYEKYLGSSIEEKQCHEMHLDCARSVSEKLSTFGLVCVDDTWLTDGKWCAKGTLAVPYLLDNDFEIVEARNRAVLLRRKRQVS